MALVNFCAGKKFTTAGAVSVDEIYITFINLIGSAAVGNIVIKDKDAAGEILFEATISANESSKFMSFHIPVRAKNGAYIELISATAVIGYSG